MEFNSPIPGQSLTRAPGSRPYERPPEFNTVDEAMEFLVPQLTSDDSSLAVVEALEKGLPAVTLVSHLLINGFMEGKWTLDLAILLAEPVTELYALIAETAGIDFTVHPEKDKITNAVVASAKDAFDKSVKKEEETVDEPSDPAAPPVGFASKPVSTEDEVSE